VAATSTLASPTAVFTTAGDQQVTLEVCNRHGCDSVTRVVKVLDPAPSVAGLPALSPAVVEVGQLVRLAGSGAGKPPLHLEWEIRSGAAVVARLAGGDTWWDTQGAAPGAYTAVLRVSNDFGPAAVSLPLPVVVAPPAPTGFFTLDPCRVVDTRGGAALASGEPRTVTVTGGACGVPAAARAVTANVTVVRRGAATSGHVAIYPSGYPPPASSIVNFAGPTRASFAVLALAADGSGAVDALARLADGDAEVDLVLDVTGYFAPLP
jgi:hypothetical protein